LQRERRSAPEPSIWRAAGPARTRLVTTQMRRSVCRDRSSGARRGESGGGGSCRRGDLNPHALAGTSPSSLPPGILADWCEPIWPINKGFRPRRTFTVGSGRAIIARRSCTGLGRAAPQSEHRTTLFLTLFESTDTKLVGVRDLGRPVGSQGRWTESDQEAVNGAPSEDQDKSSPSRCSLRSSPWVHR
jgi:hypothetical protein